jgi:hypothetical protein
MAVTKIPGAVVYKVKNKDLLFKIYDITKKPVRQLTDRLFVAVVFGFKLFLLIF